MLLKHLELQGFKSFAKKTVLDFPSGITAIVGPNGSGKSNIVDAIRWVLAEQSFKSLRSKKGEDVIFHGSTKRNALSQAKVSLKLETDASKSSLDLNEIVIARQVDRNGQSNYFLNDRKVRLLDLDAFLASSKIGGSSFRVLSQGMSDMLITLGPKEFREFIEDAAGVKEFQDKKYRSLLKLRNTRQNLDKVSALLAELTPRLRFLKKEHNKFSKRHETEENLKDVAKKLFGNRYFVLVTKQNKIAEKKKVSKNNLEELKKKLDVFKEELFSFENKFQKNKDIQETSQKIHALEEEEYSLNRTIILNQGKVELEEERLKQKFPVSKDYLSGYLKNILSLGKDSLKKADIRQSFKEIIKQIENIVLELTEGKQKDSSIAKDKIETTRRDIKELEKQRDKIKNNLKELLLDRTKQQDSLAIDRTQFIEKEKLYRQQNEEIQNIQINVNELDLEEEKVKIHQEQLTHDIKNIGIITLADVIDTSDGGDINEGKLESELWRLKRNIEHIGTIDSSVEEEYEGVSERHRFLEGESKDLRQALESLEGIIKDLNKQIEKCFKDTLVKMSESFNSYFRLMFDGGKAILESSKLDLPEESMTPTPSSDVTSGEQGRGSDPSDPDGVGEGIELNVSLPGKKIKGLNNLSGGERTLVSIALLFALVNVRKPPFLVLDEIDAALDEVNSQRFIKLLHELAKETQFIIITHNRETMRGADALYGVSEKDGVSHLLSIKLEPVEISALT